ncbi:MAG: cytochrome c biogenesis protein CcsA [Myxococcales bacterium]|nr:cytochrome c biogenesis protein [Myxococcota bacterium]MDW8281890.1 cytochrome c biogenesis protein CcsA [Myxococcales bacterium]
MSVRRWPTTGLLLLLGLSAAGLMTAPHLILAAPAESTMGFVQRIFYFHVPSAWLAMLGAFTCGGASALFLFRGSERADHIAHAAAELTVLFGLCTIVTGPLWARKAWGVFWQWDVRLTTTLLLWIIFVTYLFARRYGGPGGRQLAAGLALFGAADVPLIYVSVSIWRTIHPKTTVVSTLDPGMRPAFWVSMLTFTVLFLALLHLRLGLEAARARYEALYLEAQDTGLLDE